MSNTVTNLLTINGTDKQVAKVREFIKGSNGESISFQSIFPMPEDLKGERQVALKNLPYPPGMKPISVPDWMSWRMKYWGAVKDAETIHDDLIDAPNRILFNTASDTPLQAIAILSLFFPKVTFNVIFSDAQTELYCGEYSFTGGKVSNMVWFDAIAKKTNVPVDQQMEYYFRTHEYAREEWRKDEEGKWVNIYDEEAA